MRFLKPVLFIVVGSLLGGGAGVYFPFATHSDCAPNDVICAADDNTKSASEIAEIALTYYPLTNQFVIPIIRQENITSLVVVSISLGLMSDDTSGISAKEPKIRDALLQELFDHAYFGTFDGPFTDRKRMTNLKSSLLETAKLVLGENIVDVAITNIIRQEV